MVIEKSLTISELNGICRRVIKTPKLEYCKGIMGKICVIGGSNKYSGAPYFAALAALRAGCDLAYVVCPESASIPIKCYSPDLIVDPTLDTTFINDLDHFCSIIDAFIVGPGLGRSEDLVSLINSMITRINDFGKPCVIDADGLWYITKSQVGIPNLKNSVLTPNMNELKKLKNFLNITSNSLNDVCIALNCDYIISKAYNECISNLNSSYINEHFSSPRRIGGQGDILCGLIASFLHFTSDNHSSNSDQIPIRAQACLSASYILRYTTHSLFTTNPGFLTSEILKAIPVNIKQILDTKN